MTKVVCNLKDRCIESAQCGGAIPHYESDCEKCPFESSAECIPFHEFNRKGEKI